MALMNRLSRLITADFHAVLDRIEEPEALLNQAVRDMRDALQASELQRRELQREQLGSSQRRAELEQLLEQIEQQLDDCFEAEQEQLAKSQIRRKLTAQRQLQLIDSRHEQLTQAIEELDTELKRKRDQLDSMQQKAALFAERPAAGERDPVQSDSGAISDDEVEVAFLRERKRRARS